MLVSLSIFAQAYVPSPENMAARARFEDNRFGIFLHWGIYSMYAQGEWYLQTKQLDKFEYAKAARGFYPAEFDADAWVKAFKDAGARYICFTSRHHDGFSMFKTRTSDYNIVDGTPFHRDVMKELIDACHREGIRVHLYYSLLDWWRNDYPAGNRGLEHNHPADQADYDSYFEFMKTQIKEIMTGYGKIDAIWLDGYWDHRYDEEPFDWRIREFYDWIHSFDSSCLVGNNHHIHPLEGEDFQMLERHVVGDNTGLAKGQTLSPELPIEMCQTMNGMWGYKVADQNYKSVAEIVQLLATNVSKDSNLLLNIGPQADGALPDPALNRLAGVGEWMRLYGESIYGCGAGSVEGKWGVSTAKPGVLYLHLFRQPSGDLSIPLAAGQKVRSVTVLGGVALEYKLSKNRLQFRAPDIPVDNIDTVIRVEFK